MRELRLQLCALQTVSGLGGADDAESEAGSSGNGGGGGGLEAMLVDKARRCEHEATVARLAAAQARGVAWSQCCAGLSPMCGSDLPYRSDARVRLRSSA